LPTALEVQALVRDLTSQGVGESLASPLPLAPEISARVAAFQHNRGLPMTGVVDALTWERLVESSWTLGSRLLFLAQPYLRGDDVAQLQVRLARLGFNPGRLDGIFGPKTELALKDFQGNTGLDATGVLSKLAHDELLRLSSSSEDRTPVTTIFDLGAEGISGTIFLSGNGNLAEALSLQMALQLHSDSSLVTSEALSQGAGLVLALSPLLAIEGLHLHFWEGYMSRSQAGEELSRLIASPLVSKGFKVEVTGMSLPVLRETPMTALVVEHGNLSEQELHEIVTVFQEVLRQVIHR